MTPLLLLPGMMCDARVFAPQIAALGGLRGICIGDITGQDTVQAIAHNVLATAPARFALAGLSMGGIVAMEVLRQAPTRVERIALLDTNPCAETPDMQARRGPQMDRVTAGQLRDVMRDDMKPNYLAQGTARQTILDLCMEMAQDLGPDVFIRQSRALRDRPDQQATLAAVDMPALILCGAEDRACPPARHDLMHRLMPRSTLTIIPGAGHLPPLEQPEATNAALMRWLEQ